MSLRNWLLLSLFAGLLTGCGGGSDDTSDAMVADPPADGGAAKPADSTDSDGGEADVAVVDEPPAMLELPASIANPQLAQAYNMFKDGTDSQSVSNMAAISQSIGSMLTEKGDDASYAFFKQSAAKLREAEKLGAEIPAEAKGSVFYNETCALARDGETDAAMKSLGEAISFGFNDFDLVRSDTDLKNLQVLDNFKAKLGEWEIAAVERQKKEVAELLANNDAFDFDFKLEDIDGNEQSLEGLKGKVVIVDFWGTWCPPCRAEIPHFIKLQEEYGEAGLQMFGLNYERGNSEEENVQLAVDYVKEHGINYPCAMGTSVVRDQVPDFGGYPTTLFIDRTGKVRLKVVGLHSYNYLEAVVKVLLDESA